LQQLLTFREDSKVFVEVLLPFLRRRLSSQGNCRARIAGDRSVHQVERVECVPKKIARAWFIMFPKQIRGGGQNKGTVFRQFKSRRSAGDLIYQHVRLALDLLLGVRTHVVRVGFAAMLRAKIDATDELAHDESSPPEPGATEEGGEDWQRGLPPQQQETLAAQRLWQLADAYRAQIATQQSQALREFTANAEEVLGRVGDLLLVDEPDDTLMLRADGRFETSLDLSDMPNGTALSDEPLSDSTRPRDCGWTFGTAPLSNTLIAPPGSVLASCW